MGCLIVLMSVFAPRLAFLFLWIFFTPVVDRAFNGWIVPLLGIIFLPFTTLFYTLIFGAVGPVNIWGWLFILFGFFLDMGAYAQSYQNRNYVQKPPTE